MAPRKVTVLNIRAEVINISFLNPTNAGTPVFTQFRIEALSSVNVINATVAATSTDSGFLNILLVEGLKPNT